MVGIKSRVIGVSKRATRGSFFSDLAGYANASYVLVFSYLESEN